MKKLLFILLLPMSVFAQNKIEGIVRTLEARRFDAMTQKNEAVLNEILSDDLVYIHSSATVDDKKSYINSIISGKTNYQKVEVEESKVRTYKTSAVVTGKAKITILQNEKETIMNLRYTDVYQKIGKNWQMVSWNSVKIL
jgi:hypothetical protein